MTPFHDLLAPACRLKLSNVDTDQLLPARFMSQPRSEGYGGFLFHDLARDDAGALRPDFPLNRTQDAAILVARRNFGCGSSREGAVYALVDAGIRAVLAPSFGDIFAGNAANNGLVAARISEDVAETLLSGEGPLTVDLRAQTVSQGAACFAFDIDPVHREKLLNGWDDVDLTMSRRTDIEAFARTDAAKRPWLVPG